ncbi:uncharacterized protein DAT39_019915, partial [Clarias magur]
YICTHCTMINISYICILWIFADMVHTEPQCRVSGTVGSAVVLPCNLWTTLTDTLHIRWVNDDGLVFEKLNTIVTQGEGYEGRVDVPEDALRKANCSLVLRNLTLKDAGVYMSHQKVIETVRKLTIVNLSVSVNKNENKTDALSAEPEISVSDTVGSTVVLPCKLTSVDPEKLIIRWASFEELVFERNNVKTFQGERYEGRVDVSVDGLRMGNCSLVLRDLRLSDAGIYTSYSETNHTSDSKYIAPEELRIGSVKLSVSSEVNLHTLTHYDKLHCVDQQLC